MSARSLIAVQTHALRFSTLADMTKWRWRTVRHARDTAEVIEQFNRAFTGHDASLLVELVAEDCVMESIEPAPDGTRYEGREACLLFWQNLAADRNGAFAPEHVVVAGEHAIIRWRYRFGPGFKDSVRGVTVLQVRHGKVVEALGYAKTGAGSAADAVRAASQTP